MWPLNPANTIGDIVFHADAKLFSQHQLKPPIFYNIDAPPPADTVWPTELSPPSLEIQKITDVTAYPRRVLIKDNQVLRPSFFKHPNHKHGALVKRDNGTYRLRGGAVSSDVKHDSLESAIYADSPFPNVFGHVLLEVMTSFWAKDFLDSNIKIATSVDINKYIGWFSKLGLGKENFFQIIKPVDIKNLYVPSHSVLLRRYIHPVARNYLRRALISSEFNENKFGERLYISRLNIPDRKLLNEHACQKIFELYGFNIFYPELHTPAEQISAFKNAKFIAGSAGSAMHNLIFSAPDTKVLLLSSIGWVVVADALVTATFSNPLGYVLGYPVNHSATSTRTQDDWFIDTDDVKMAIEKHFSIFL